MTDGGSVLARSAHGIETLVRDGAVHTIFLYLKRERGGTYDGPLVLGVRADMKRAEIEALLGPPSVTGTSTFRPHGPWIKYARPDAQVHFQLGPDDALRQVTIMRPDWKPGD
jgi:hypothetical protein